MSHLGGTKNFARKGRGITQKRGWGWCRNDGVADFLLLYSSITFTVCVYRGGMGSKVSFITFWFFILLSQPGKILIQVFIVLKNCIICIFLIHSDSLQRMPTALFKLVWNTQKSALTNFFKYQGKMFLNIENVLVS